VSLLGIDDFEWADYFEPRLTLMAQPCNEIGRQAADLLVQRIAAPDSRRQTVRLSPALRVRESCGAPS
jgi:LacI family transcriptional regulator